MPTWPRPPAGTFWSWGRGLPPRRSGRSFAQADMGKRLHLVGSLEGQALVDAYHAMDVFVFASCTETQGMVLTEAMAAGKPVVALDGPGVREVVRDGCNGRLLARSWRPGVCGRHRRRSAPLRPRSAGSSKQARGRRRNDSPWTAADASSLNIYDRLSEPPTEWTQGPERLAPRDGRDQSGVGTAQEHGRGGRPGRKAVNTKHDVRDGASQSEIRSCRRWFSRSEWLIRLLRLTKTQGIGGEPGLVLIQIDGLCPASTGTRDEQKGIFPSSPDSCRSRATSLHSLYSGLPSSTPAMTAELLYGVKCAVPSFSFYSRPTRTIFRMFDSRSARQIDQRLRAQAPPLLAGGSAYACIYTGGAEETHFCACTMGLDELLRRRYPLRLFILLLFSVYSLVRVGVLLAIEFLLAVFDCARGLIAGQDLWKRAEVRAVPGGRVDSDEGAGDDRRQDRRGTRPAGDLPRPGRLR